eukprot:s6387_g5.t1
MVVSSGEEDLEDCNIFDAQDDDDQIPPEGLEESHANEDVGSVPSADGESQLDAGNAGKPDDDDQIPPEGLEESHANEDVGSVPSADGESQLDAGNAGKPESVPVPFFEPRCRTDGHRAVCEILLPVLLEVMREPAWCARVPREQVRQAAHRRLISTCSAHGRE